MAIDTAADKPQAENQTNENAPSEPENPAMRFWNFIRPILILIVALFAVRSSVADWNDVPTGSMIPTILEGDRIFVNKLAYDLKVPFTTIHMADWSNPKRGEIVVFFSPDDGIRLVKRWVSFSSDFPFIAFFPDSPIRLVKRCVAVPGDTLQLVQNKLFINGVEATYGPLDPKFANGLLPDEQKRHVFANETVGDKSHAVMATIGTWAMRDFGPVTVPPGKYFMMGDNRDNSKDSRYFKGNFVDRNLVVGRATGVAISLDIKHAWVPRWSRFFSKLN